MTKVLTIQDISCVGQCSLTVALPVISAMGIETSVLPSAVLSTHTSGFSDFTFRDLTQDLPLIKEHWIKENLKFDYIYTGYIGSKKQIKYIEEIIDTCLASKGLVVVDPVMADHGKFYPGFDAEYANEVKLLCKKAGIIVPNLTEAVFLVGGEYIEWGYDQLYIENLIKKLAEINGKSVVLTGVSFEKNRLGVAIYENGQISYYFRDRIDANFHGTGDVFSSSLVGALANNFDIIKASKVAVDFTIESIKHTIIDPLHTYGVKFEKAIPYLIKRIGK